ncbi:MAG: multidrug effflux MFS transporter [Pseudomonadota bacterium]
MTQGEEEAHPTEPRDPVPLFIPLLLIFASVTSILSTDLYTPSLPHLVDIFDSDAMTVQLTMTLNLAGFAIAQLFYGPLSERVGRRPVILCAMVAFGLASLACALAFSIESLIIARTFQGLTACAEAVIGYAVVRELYGETGAVKVLAAYGMAIAVAPAVGPVIGGQMHVWFGWRSNFFLMTGLIVVACYFLWRHLPETLARPDPRAIDPRRMMSGYLSLLRNPRYMAYCGLTAITFSGLFAFITAAPFLYITTLQVPTERYGYYYAGIIVAYFLGSLLVNRLAGRFSIDAMVFWGLVFCALGGLSLWILIAGQQQTPTTVTVAVSLYAFGLGLVLATAPIRAFDVGGAGYGFAAALLGALEMGGGSLGALAVGLMHDGSARPIAWVLAASAIGALLLYAVVRPWRQALPSNPG